jgi:hypothetical protein
MRALKGVHAMRGQAEITVPEIIRVAATRFALGVGLGLVLSNRMTKTERRTIGTTLLLAGAVSAGTLALELFGQPHAMTFKFGQPRADVEPSESPERPRERNAVGIR